MIQFFLKHKLITVLISVALALFLITGVSFALAKTDSPVGDAARTVINVISKPFRSAGEGLSSLKDFFGYRQLEAENEELRKKVEDLQRQLKEDTLKQSELEELRNLSQSLNYASMTGSYTYVTANVVSMDGSLWFNIFSIDIGTENGIQKDDVVLNGDGLVGKIYEVGKDWAKVISIIDTNNNVSFYVSRDNTALGILYGDGEGRMKGYMLDSEASVIEGDTLVTTGMELYPEGIVIGKVSNVEWDAGTLLTTLEIQPTVKFKSLQMVTVAVPVQR